MKEGTSLVKLCVRISAVGERRMGVLCTSQCSAFGVSGKYTTPGVSGKFTSP